MNGVNQVVQATLDGYGFAYVPQALVNNQIQSGDLITFLPNFCITYPGYYLYYTSRLQSSAAFKIILETLRHRNIGTSEHRNIGTSEHRNIGTLGHWDIGTLGHWDIGTLGHWDIGTLGHWDIGTLKLCSVVQ